jgi:hypothetical protein
MRKLFEITSDTAATSRDTLIKAGEHAVIELSEETLDEVTGGDGKASSSSAASGVFFLRFDFALVAVKTINSSDDDWPI